MWWAHPKMHEDVSPPCRAHSMTVVGQKILVIGRGRTPRITACTVLDELDIYHGQRFSGTTAHWHVMVLYQNEI